MEPSVSAAAAQIKGSAVDRDAVEKADAQGREKKARADVVITSEVASPPLLTEVSAIITAIAAGGKPKDLLAKVDLSADAKWMQFVETAISLPDSHMLLTVQFDEFTQPPPPYWEVRENAIISLYHCYYCRGFRLTSSLTQVGSPSSLLWSSLYY